jgi:transposase
MILGEQDLDLERHREQLKAIRRGEWMESRLRDWAQAKERDLEALYASSPLPHTPREPEIKQLLLKCLEHHYGDLSTAITIERDADRVLKEVATLTERWRK